MASFVLDPAEFPPLTRSSSTEFAQPVTETQQNSSKTFSEAADSASLKSLYCNKFFLAESSPIAIGTVSTINARPTIVFSEMETQSLVADFRLALIGKFSHGSPPYSQLHCLLAKFGLKGAFAVSLINNKHALISLSNEADYTYLWLRRICYLNGFPMRVFKWSPTFTPDNELSIVPIWVNFPALPAHLFRKETLFTIASNIGTPLQIADSTFNQSNLSKARVCVEIDLLKPFLEEIDLKICGETIVQRIEYEEIPRHCTLCKHIGHNDSECYSKGNAPKPPRRRVDGKTAATAEHKQQQTKKGKWVAVEKEPIVGVEQGECSNASLEILHEGTENVQLSVLSVENEDENVQVSQNDDDNNAHAAECDEVNDDECDDVIVEMKGDEIMEVNENAIKQHSQLEDDILAEVVVENDALFVDGIPENEVHAENEALVEHVNVHKIEKENECMEDVDGGGKDASGALILRQDNPLCNLTGRTSWCMIDGALRILETVNQFGKVMKGIEYDIEEVIKRNQLATKTAMLYQKCVMIFDRVSQLNLKPLDERSPPIATRTRRRKKGKNSLEPHDFHYF
ncbi:UNVERIFIED_CONTAM: hypothetical protein Sradi_1433600 [Sesamum radiatum]|uniref:DUF4283 domain-containing protein n=1 Tax=Sesamum radiatum TaxID=300843 RepID=A0AAW2U5V4_SESRA